MLTHLLLIIYTGVKTTLIIKISTSKRLRNLWQRTLAETNGKLGGINHHGNVIG